MAKTTGKTEAECGRGGGEPPAVVSQAVIVVTEYAGGGMIIRSDNDDTSRAARYADALLGVASAAHGASIELVRVSRRAGQVDRAAVADELEREARAEAERAFDWNPPDDAPAKPPAKPGKAPATAPAKLNPGNPDALLFHALNRASPFPHATGGMSDAELRNEVGKAFLAAGPPPDGYTVKGGADPRFWPTAGRKGKVLSGRALLKAVRRVVAIPTPSEVSEADRQIADGLAALAECEAFAPEVKPDPVAPPEPKVYTAAEVGQSHGVLAAAGMGNIPKGRIGRAVPIVLPVGGAEHATRYFVVTGTAWRYDQATFTLRQAVAPPKWAGPTQAVADRLAGLGRAKPLPLAGLIVTDPDGVEWVLAGDETVIRVKA